MKNILLRVGLMSLSISYACGREEKQSPAASTPAASHVESSSTSLKLSGFVGNAFEVTVDSASYDDLEDFYTKELDRLSQKVRESGLDGNFTVRFEVAIGFKDLWSNMMVYIAADASTGYQASSQVTNSGEFSVDFPKDAKDDTFKVRATKRIRVIIDRGAEVLTYCYNFSATEKAIVLTESQKPVILDSFSTSLTKYDCISQSQKDGLAIPQSNEPKEHQIRPGQSKTELAQLIDSTGLVISDKKWCWRVKPGQVETVCAVSNISECACSMSFDEDGKLVSQVNIASKFLDISAW